jgi:hypothetical protein
MTSVLGQYYAGNYVWLHYFPGSAPDAAIEGSGTLFQITEEMFTTVATYNSNPYLLLYGGLGPGWR